MDTRVISLISKDDLKFQFHRNLLHHHHHHHHHQVCVFRECLPTESYMKNSQFFLRPTILFPGIRFPVATGRSVKDVYGMGRFVPNVREFGVKTTAATSGEIDSSGGSDDKSNSSLEEVCVPLDSLEYPRGLQNWKMRRGKNNGVPGEERHRCKKFKNVPTDFQLEVLHWAYSKTINSASHHFKLQRYIVRNWMMNEEKIYKSASESGKRKWRIYDEQLKFHLKSTLPAYGRAAEKHLLQSISELSF